MENYTKGEVEEVEEPPVFSLDETGVQMRVTGGSKLKNLMGFAMKKIKVSSVTLLKHAHAICFDFYNYIFM